MSYFEIDFLNVGEKQSGDAIALRYGRDGTQFVHVVDGGFQDDGPHVMTHLRRYYDGVHVDHIVLTHPDNDHAGGLKAVLEQCAMRPGGGLWMLRPWTYAEELLPHFPTYSTVPSLTNTLRSAYPTVAELERIAQHRGIQIREPFQGTKIGAFTVLAPSRNRYLQLILNSDKTPKTTMQEDTASMRLYRGLQMAANHVVHYAKAAWGVEVFSLAPTSVENEMSVVQYACLSGKKILLTGDAGRDALTEAADFAPSIGLFLPGIDRFDVPHHGSRRNLSTKVLDRWLGFCLPQRLPEGAGSFQAIISANSEDKDHPRRAVVRGLIHRGADVTQTAGPRGAYLRTFQNLHRDNERAADRLPYPEDQESV